MNILVIIFSSLFILGFTNPASYSASPNVSSGSQQPACTYSIWVNTLTGEGGISEPAVHLALNGYMKLRYQNRLGNDSLITIIDFSKPSDQERLFIFNLSSGSIEKRSLVAHGRGSGNRLAESFSNTPESNKSSLGLYLTLGAYQGKNGYSLRLEGLNPGMNDNALSRAVVVHGASYVSEHFIRQNGRLGRSFGCPALPVNIVKDIIDLIKDGSCLFIYHPQLYAATPQSGRGITQQSLLYPSYRYH